MKEVYISIDIEADGPIPGDNSMLSFGAAAFTFENSTADSNCPTHGFDKEIDADCICPRWKMIGTFGVNLELLPGATPNPDTMAWWANQPKAWAECRKDPIPPDLAMTTFGLWLREIAKEGPLVIAGYPVTFDFNFIYWYYIHFCGFPAPFGFQGLDIKTLAMDRMSCAYKHATKRNMPKSWFIGSPAHTHKALDDAIGQGVLLMNILTDNKVNR